jgi:hypothetical protein
MALAGRLTDQSTIAEFFRRMKSWKIRDTSGGLHRYRDAMGLETLSDVDLLVRIAALWLRDRREANPPTSLSAPLRELLDAAGAGRPALDTLTETPASRRKSSTPTRG